MSETTMVDAKQVADDRVTTLDIPLIMNGRQILPSQRDAVHHLDYEAGVRVRVPVMLPEDLALLRREKRQVVRALSRLSSDEISRFLNQAGDRWLAGISAGRTLAETYSPAITGFSPGMIQTDCDTLGHFLVQRFHFWDTISAEFGHERIFDEWISNQECLVRAFPRGLLVQYLVGNLPLAGLYTVLRGIITRNANLLKLPTRDPVTCLGLVQALLEVDPDHPVSRAQSVAYWPHDSAIAESCIEAADAVCVWGGGEAVEAVKRKVRANVPVAEYGPRWSVSMIDLTRCDSDEAAQRLVEDSAFYDQEACFNTQRAYIKGDVASLRAGLRKYYELFAKRYPLGANRDALAHRAATLMEARFLGLEVDEGHDWAVVVVPGANPPRLQHPLTRTLFLHVVQSLDLVADQLNAYSQSVTVFPFSLAEEYRDDLAAAGANRVAELGWTRMPRAGFTHDGVYGLHSLVRLVSVERSRSSFGKYYIQPADPKTWQRSYFAGERWWSDPWWALVQRNVVDTGR